LRLPPAGLPNLGGGGGGLPPVEFISTSTLDMTAGWREVPCAAREAPEVAATEQAPPRVRAAAWCGGVKSSQVGAGGRAPCAPPNNHPWRLRASGRAHSAFAPLSTGRGCGQPCVFSRVISSMSPPSTYTADITPRHAPAHRKRAATKRRKQDERPPHSEECCGSNGTGALASRGRGGTYDWRSRALWVSVPILQSRRV
jgi:hypothetical protein